MFMAEGDFVFGERFHNPNRLTTRIFYYFWVGMEFPASNNRSPLEILVSTAFAGRQLNTGLRVPASSSKCLKHHPQTLFLSLSLPCRSTCAFRCHFRDMAPESSMRCRSKICCCKGITYDSPPPMSEAWYFVLFYLTAIRPVVLLTKATPINQSSHHTYDLASLLAQNRNRTAIVANIVTGMHDA